MNMNVQVKARREKVSLRLESQLKLGNKPEKIDGKSSGRLIPLNDNDIKRINSEIEKLKKRY